MRSRPLHMLLFFAITFVGQASYADEESEIVVGQTVMPVKRDAAMHSAPSPNAPPLTWWPGTCVLTVRGVTGEWLRTDRGWIIKSDVVRCDRAIAFFTDEIARSPSVFASSSRCVARMAANKRRPALDDARDAIRLDGSDALGFYCRGLTAARAGDIGTASADFRRATALDESFGPAYVDNAKTSLEKGDPRAAVADCDEAVRLAPSWAEPYFMRGFAREQMRSHQEAVVDLTESIRRDDLNGEAYRLRAIVRRKLGEREEAMRDINESIKRSPKFAQSYLLRALLWRDDGNKGRATDDARTAVRLAPDLEDGHGLLAALAYDGADYDGAMREFDNVIRLNPQCAMAYTARAMIWATCPDASRRDGEKALVSANIGCNLSNFQKPQHVDALAAAYAEVGDFASAVKWQRRVVELLAAEGASRASRAEQRDALQLYRKARPLRLKRVEFVFSMKVE